MLNQFIMILNIIIVHIFLQLLSYKVLKEE